jgi:pyridoxine 5-phosphate synthase
LRCGRFLLDFNMPLLLGVNVDHVATLRQARYAHLPDSPNAEPCPVSACDDAMAGGADSITVHVRGDRRHMQERDVFLIKEKCSLPLNLEMGVTPEMLAMALRLQPKFVCLVPETREEVTTEGGLDAVTKRREVGDCIKRLQAAGILVSLFIDPDLDQVRISAELGAEMIELHTGCFANAIAQHRDLEVSRLIESAKIGHEIGLQINAGHGINSQNIAHLYDVPFLTELNIGHHLVARAIKVGFEQSVREIKALMENYRGAQ